MRRFVLAALLLAAVPAFRAHRNRTAHRVPTRRRSAHHHRMRHVHGARRRNARSFDIRERRHHIPSARTRARPGHTRPLGDTTYATGELLYDFERELMMIPIAHEPQPGAYGAQWVSDIHVENRGDEPIPLGPYICSFTANVFPCSTLPRTIAPHTTVPLPGRPFSGTRALLVPKESEAGAELDARMFEFFPPTDANFYWVHHWADVLASARNRGETHVRISIEPEVRGNWGATWAMLTLTENDTQRVLVHAPH